MSWLCLLFSALLSCVGQLCQKQAVIVSDRRFLWQHRVLWLGCAVISLAAAMLLWLQVLRSLPVGVAYPMLSMNFIWITLAARWLWHEPVATYHWYGIGCIITGISLLSGAI